jgi:hypothetical protein
MGLLGTMNLFRFSGDMLHLFSFFVLLKKVFEKQDCAGAWNAFAYAFFSPLADMLPLFSNRAHPLALQASP